MQKLIYFCQKFNPLFWIGTGGTIGQGMMWILCDSSCGDKTQFQLTFWTVLTFIGLGLSWKNLGKKWGDQ